VTPERLRRRRLKYQYPSELSEAEGSDSDVGTGTGTLRAEQGRKPARCYIKEVVEPHAKNRTVTRESELEQMAFNTNLCQKGDLRCRKAAGVPY